MCRGSFVWCADIQLGALLVDKPYPKSELSEQKKKKEKMNRGKSHIREWLHNIDCDEQF